MSEKKSTAATVLAYTEKELAAIDALEKNKGSMLTAKELGIPGITITGLIAKAKKVKDGILANPDNLPVLDIKQDKVDREVVEVRQYTVYGLSK